MNYTDDISFIAQYSENHFKSPNISEDSVATFREKNSKRFGVINLLKKCYDNVQKDPLEIITELKNDFQVNEVFCKQEINKNFFKNAYMALEELENVLKERRK